MKRQTKKQNPKQTKKELMFERKDAWSILDRKDVFRFSEDYKKFLTEAKTEREAVAWISRNAEKAGFKPWPKSKDRFYVTFKDKAVALVVKGKRDPKQGLAILAAHLDSPRIDVKPVPLYEDTDSNLALFDTHYYGGIKKYQWVNHPLALHGVVVTKDGKRIEVRIGEEGEEPTFVIPDLLPHLSRKQMKKNLEDAIQGENLDAVVGHLGTGEEKGRGREREKDGKARIKKALLDALNEQYGLTESDFISADLELVPAGPALDVGFDHSLVGGYGHDDKSSVFTCFQAIKKMKKPERTCIAFFFDREEIGSEGNSGAKSRFLRYVASLVCDEPDLCLMRSKAISADVDAAMHPLYKDVFEKKNTGVLGKGIILTKYTGYRGKMMGSEARAEYVAEIRRILDKARIPWQPGGIGKVDEGGGGTVAMFLARYGMDVIDMGVPVLSMHSPFELISKADLYSAYMAYLEFLRRA